MLKTYITTVPLQGKLDPMLYQRERAEAPTATCFPIVQVMRDTLEPGDTVQLLAIRQENADTARNYQRLLEELTRLGIAEHQVQQIHLPEDQCPETLIGLCRDLVDALPQVTRVYACITYGSKSIPVVTLTALTCAEATHTCCKGIARILDGFFFHSGEVVVGAEHSLCAIMRTATFLFCRYFFSRFHIVFLVL